MKNILIIFGLVFISNFDFGEPAAFAVRGVKGQGE
jgi:hypothetical protein